MATASIERQPICGPNKARILIVARKLGENPDTGKILRIGGLTAGPRFCPSPACISAIWVTTITVRKNSTQVSANEEGNLIGGIRATDSLASTGNKQYRTTNAVRKVPGWFFQESERLLTTRKDAGLGAISPAAFWRTTASRPSDPTSARSLRLVLDNSPAT